MRFNEWWGECAKLRDQVIGNPFGQVRAGVTLSRDCGLSRNVLEVEFDSNNNIIILNDAVEMSSRAVARDYTTQKAAYAEVLSNLRERTTRLVEQKEMIIAAIVQDQIPNAAILRMEGNKDAGEISYEELLRSKVKSDIERLYKKFESVARWHPMNSFDFDYPLTLSFQGEDPQWKLNLTKASQASLSLSVGHFNIGHDDKITADLKEHLIFLTNMKTIEYYLDKMLKWLQAGKGI